MGRIKEQYIEYLNKQYENIKDTLETLCPDCAREDQVEDLSDNLSVQNQTEQYNKHPGQEKAVFFTINPSDHYWSKFEHELEEEDVEQLFRHQVSQEFIKLGQYYARRKNMRLDFNLYFEKTKRVHCHGVILGMPESYYGYGGELKYMSQKLHKVFGKPRLNSDICADFRWTDDNWDGSYLVKQNYMKPIRIRYE